MHQVGAADAAVSGPVIPLWIGVHRSALRTDPLRGNRLTGSGQLYVERVASMTLRSDLLMRGYFPENLPPVFTSTDLGRFADAHFPINEYLTRSQSRTRPALYNASKRGHQRRVFSIPNPIAAADTALFLHQHWLAITKDFQKSPFSASRPAVDAEGSRVITITSHDELSHLKAALI